MSAICISEQLQPVPLMDAWRYSRTWRGADDEVTFTKGVAVLGYFSEAEAWHEVERQGLRAAADAELPGFAGSGRCGAAAGMGRIGGSTVKQPNLKAMGVPAPKGAKPVRPCDVNLGQLASAQSYKLRGKGGPAKGAGVK